MDMKNLYILRFKRGTQAVQTAYVTASDLEKAQATGKWWCGQNPSTRYVMVEPAIVADESDLKYDSIDARELALHPPPPDPPEVVKTPVLAAKK